MARRSSAKRGITPVTIVTVVTIVTWDDPYSRARDRFMGSRSPRVTIVTFVTAVTLVTVPTPSSFGIPHLEY